MSGDYSRKRFNPEKHYQGVLKQQGRVDLDAEWNEYVDLLDRRWRAETIDVVGRCGVPRKLPMGSRCLSAGQLTIGQGRIYVDGYLAENHGANPRSTRLLRKNMAPRRFRSHAQPYGAGPLSAPAPSVRWSMWMSGAVKSATCKSPDLSSRRSTSIARRASKLPGK